MLTVSPKISPALMLDWRLRKGNISLARRVFKSEQIISKLREAEVLISAGNTIGEVSRKIGVTEQTPITAGAESMVAWGRTSQAAEGTVEGKHQTKETCSRYFSG